MIKKQCIILLSLCLWSQMGQTESTSVAQTKNKLSELQIKINKLQQTLNLAHDKHKTLDKELAETEKNMNKNRLQLQTTQSQILASQTKIKALNDQMSTLNISLKKEQSQLAEHLRIRYKTGEYQPLKWLINQDNPDGVHRIFTYHEYMLKSRQMSILHIKKIKEELYASEMTLNQEIITLQNLQQEQKQHQLALEQDKQYHKTLLQTLQKDIQGKQQTLEEYKQNQANLSRILATLIKEQNKKPTLFPVFQSNHKLAMPVMASKNNIEKINQGIVFYANEGVPVQAASSGKVVFNDWLKGYGYLLIIDHGNGLMTLYAHNQSLFKKKGDMVIKGEKIASVGHSGAIRQNGLYFEVRRRGKAVSPLAWLA